MRNHFGENVYKCTFCEASFRIRRDLKDHVSSHYRDGDINESSVDEKTSLNFMKTNNALFGCNSVIKKIPYSAISAHLIEENDANLFGTDSNIEGKEEEEITDFNQVNTIMTNENIVIDCTLINSNNPNFS